MLGVFKTVWDKPQLFEVSKVGIYQREMLSSFGGYGGENNEKITCRNFRIQYMELR